MANIVDVASSAVECARYIFDSQSDQESYMEFIQGGNDPREHILYHAALVLGLTEDFEPDIQEFLNPPLDSIKMYGTML